MAADGSSFPPLHIFEPLAGYAHTHSVIMIHGRGSSGQEFAEDFFACKLFGGKRSFRSQFPSWRWIFPSSRSLWSSAFEEEIPAWFEAHSLTDINARQDLQMDGIKKSKEYLDMIMGKEVGRLHGARENLFLCGISQGAAIGLWTLLCQTSSGRNLGGFVGASCWLPFAGLVGQFLGNVLSPAVRNSETPDELEAWRFVESMMADIRASLAENGAAHSLLRTPVFLGHGIDDAYVDITVGRQVRDVLACVGLTVEWNEYTGADQEGHWFKEADELDDIADFLAAAADKAAQPAGEDQSEELKAVCMAQLRPAFSTIENSAGTG